MQDKTAIENSENAQIPSKAFREYIESLVEEVVLNGATLNDHKKYLQRYSQEERLDYDTLEKNLGNFFDTLKELKSHKSNPLLLFAKMLAKDCYLEEIKVDKLVSAMNEAREKEAKRIAAEKKAEEKRLAALKKAEEERIAHEKAEREAAEEAKRKAKEEHERREREEAERRAKMEAEKKKSLETIKQIGGHEYVDLGLPSGTLWATCNVGATTPEDYGDYYAWGEVQSKSVFNIIRYKHYDQTYNKYNGRDKLTLLQSDDDVAMSKWGMGWRMPTKEEWNELLKYTHDIWTSYNGIVGRLFTATNGNSLFLPAAGYRSDSDLCYNGGLGDYWSCSPNIFDHHAVHFFFNSGYHLLLSDGHRYHGCSVRAVHSSF